MRPSGPVARPSMDPGALGPTRPAIPIHALAAGVEASTTPDKEGYEVRYPVTAKRRPSGATTPWWNECGDCIDPTRVHVFVTAEYANTVETGDQEPIEMSPE